MTIECSVAGVLEGANKLQDQEEVYQQVNDAYIRSIEMAGKRCDVYTVQVLPMVVVIRKVNCQFVVIV